MRRLIFLVIILLFILGLLTAVKQYSPQLMKAGVQSSILPPGTENVKVISEESVVIDVVKKSSPSVVTIAETSPQLSQQNDPFSFFNLPDDGSNSQSNEPQNIGSGFLVTADGFIVTNKHVVSDTGAKYTVITTADKKYAVEKIYRDPLNDIAILKINASQNGETLTPLNLGDSSKLQVGQLVVAIGTPLGQFSNSVTTGVVSGLGRGITAGSEFEGFAEQLDNVIQTDAAINPGNSGGPLLNSSGQVIGVNTAVSQSGQNIGFALPINVIKDSLKNFNQTGQFNRPYLGVQYQMITRDEALRNDLPEGAFVRNVLSGSAAEKGGLKNGDIITQIDGQKLQAGKLELAQIISKKKVGDSLTMTVWHDNGDGSAGKTTDITVTLDSAPEQ
jgi:S1-C subfamily serine protease